MCDESEIRCECCRHKRGWWTLCTSEMFHRFRTSVDYGLSKSEEQDSRKRCGPNQPQEITSQPDFWIANSSALLHGTRIALVGSLGTAWLGSKTLRSVPFQRGILPWAAAFAGMSVVGFYVSNGLRRKLLEYTVLRQHLLAHPPSATSISVTREGKTYAVNGSELVPGDMVHLQSGQWVPADCRVVEATDLEVDFSFLPPSFGGIHAVTERPEPEAAPLEGARCCVLATAHITRGTGIAMVTRIGDLTCPRLVLDSLRGLTLDSLMILVLVDAAWLASTFPALLVESFPRLMAKLFRASSPRVVGAQAGGAAVKA